MDADNRPNRDELGFLTAALYARADERGIDRALADRSVEYLILGHAPWRAAFERLLDRALAVAASKPKEGASNDQDGHGRGLQGGP